MKYKYQTTKERLIALLPPTIWLIATAILLATIKEPAPYVTYGRVVLIAAAIWLIINLIIVKREDDRYLKDLFKDDIF